LAPGLVFMVPLGSLTFSITIFSIMALSIKGLFATLGIIAHCHYAEYRYAECRVLYFVIVNVILVSVIMVSVIVQNVVTTLHEIE
jgi:hypothetical protein